MAGNADILVTAGPTWIPLDSVRVVTNIFSGRTGYFIAEGLARRGYRVNLLLGAAAFTPKPRKNLSVYSFRYFNDLRLLVRRMLTDKTYSMIIHTAAVSDYQAVRVY
jgi:phosphopantothenoylcysteine synthetase/decarboxylase